MSESKLDIWLLIKTDMYADNSQNKEVNSKKKKICTSSTQLWVLVPEWYRYCSMMSYIGLSRSIFLRHGPEWRKSVRSRSQAQVGTVRLLLS